MDNECVIGIDYASDGGDVSVVTCSSCKKSIEVINGKLPDIGWCGCYNTEQEIVKDRV